jgi:LSD1 subclass zinc finger protein
MNSYFKDGKFSDFTIICDGKEYPVHRCFIAPQSKYFERAFTGMFKEAAENKIELNDDKPSIVERMVYYFYNFDYDWNEEEYAESGLQPSHFEFYIDIRMYAIADKYDIPGLKTLAAENIKGVLLRVEKYWEVLDKFTHELNQINLPESDTTLRDLLTDAWLRSGKFCMFLYEDEDRFKRLVSEAPWLALALLTRTLPSLRYSNDTKQASCGACKTPAFFTQGIGSVKCKRCQAMLPIKEFALLKSEVLVQK